MRKYKLLITIVSPLILLTLIVLVPKKLTDGFSLKNIDSVNNLQSTFGDSIEAASALNQDYHYHGKGSQSFVFASADNRYVLKFFKHYRWKMPLYSSLLPSHYRAHLAQKKREAQDDTFQSCIYAFSHMKDETAFIYAHFSKAGDLPPVPIIDKLGRKHLVNINRYDFVIQKMGISAEEKFIQLRKENQHELAKGYFQKLLTLVLKRRELGFNDKDPHLLKNFGFIGEEAFELDIGGFFIDPRKDMDYFYGHELNKIINKVKPWLEANYPELLPAALEMMAQIKPQRMER